MNHLQQFLVPYLIAQAVAIGFLWASFKNTRLTRLLFVLLFLWASVTNFYFGFNKPDVYLEYAPMALPFYRHFITGWFSHYNHILVPLIAAGQLLIAVGMALENWWVKAACIGAIVFLLSIAPLMIGAGFPFSLLVSWAAWRVLQKDERRTLWKRTALPLHRATH